jgi:hypothetical protein
MVWWIWLLLAWAVVALVGGLWFGCVLRTAEARDWARRGQVDRRSRPRDGGLEEWIRRGRPERRRSSPEQERAFLAARAAHGASVPDRRRRSRVMS